MGSYPNSASPAGAFDMAGNVNEWTEEVVNGLNRVARGGGYVFAPEWTGASNRLINFDAETTDGNNIGFRLVFVPEPATGALVALGLAFIGACRRSRES